MAFMNISFSEVICFQKPMHMLAKELMPDKVVLVKRIVFFWITPINLLLDARLTGHLIILDCV